MEYVEHILFSLMLIANFVIAFYVILKSKNRIIGGLYFIMSSSLSIWGISSYILDLFQSIQTRLFLARLDYVLGVIPTLFFVIFSIYFPNKLKNLKSKILEIILFLISFFVLILSITDLIIKNISIENNFTIIERGSFHIVYTLFLSLFILFGSFLMLYKYRKSESIEKSQIFYYSLGGISTAIYIVILDQILPYFYKYPTKWGLLAIPIYIATAAYAIIRYRFMDIRIIIKRSSIYIATVALAILIYILIVYLLQTYFVTNSLNNNATVISALIVIIGIPFIQKGSKNLVEKVFTKEEYDPQKALTELESKSTDRHSAEVIKEIENILKKQFSLEFVKTELADVNKNLLLDYLKQQGESIIIKDEIKFLHQKDPHSKDLYEKLAMWFKYNKAKVGVILTNQENIIGVVLLGAKKQNETYSVQDIELLNQFQVRISIVLANTLLYESTIAQLKK
ncbi:MAG: histidine kinase N-terminal 7TM domain-containing protein [bacterium]